MNRRTEIGRFLVKTDSGKEYTIVQYQEYTTRATGGGAPLSEIAGLMKLFTSTGLRVNQIDDKTFKIVETDEVVWNI